MQENQANFPHLINLTLIPVHWKLEPGYLNPRDNQHLCRSCGNKFCHDHEYKPANNG